MRFPLFTLSIILKISVVADCTKNLCVDKRKDDIPNSLYEIPYLPTNLCILREFSSVNLSLLQNTVGIIQNSLSDLFFLYF